MNPRKLICLLLVLLMVFSLAACGSSGSGSDPAAPAADGDAEAVAPVEEASADTLRLAVTSEPNHLNPKGIPEVVDEWILPNIMETLLTFDDDGNLIPMLAESYEYESDTMMLWHLRQGVKFHNGEELTAEDALFSLWLTSQAITSTAMCQTSILTRARSWTITPSVWYSINLPWPPCITSPG